MQAIVVSRKSHYRPQKRTVRRYVPMAAAVVVLGSIVTFATSAVAPQLAVLHRLTAEKPSTQSTAEGINEPVINDDKALGIAAGSSLPGLSNTELAARLDGIRATGATWVRLDFDWSLIQPESANVYDWSTYDRLVTALSSRHFAILAILDYTPSWARLSMCTTDSHCAPQNSGQFATFAAAVAKRYSPQGIHYWEVWNEPNNRSFWQPGANPARYVSMLRAVYPALHAADAHAYVITGGLSPQATGNGAYAPYDFLQSVYTQGGKGYFDAVGDHPYTFPLTPDISTDQAWAQMAAPTRSLRSLMVANDDGAKKIWITEFGAPTGGPGSIATIQNPNLEAHPYVVDQALQAKILSSALQLYGSYPWAGPFFYYTYQDPGTDPSTNENFFGLVTAQGGRKQAYAVFKSAASRYLP